MFILQIQKILLLKETENIINIHFRLSDRFSPLHSDDQNLKMKRPTSTVPNIPNKTSANNRNTSLHVTNTVQKDLLYVLPRIISKISYLLQFQIIVCMLALPKTAINFSATGLAILRLFRARSSLTFRQM